MEIPADIPALSPPPGPNAARNPRILIVDDNPAIHEDFCKILGAEASDSSFDADEIEVFGEVTRGRSLRCTFELGFASQGAQALEMVRAAKEEGYPYSLVFTDMRMPPGWDGCETTVRLWQVDPDLQIVICTAYSDRSWEEMMEKFQSPERVLILKKPFDAVEVLQLAHALTEKWSLLQSARRNTEQLERMVLARTQELREANARLQSEIAIRHHAEERVREQAGLLDKAQDAIFVHDLDERVLFWNRSAERLYGLATETVLGYPLPASLSPEPSLFAEARKITLEKGDWTGDLAQRTATGREFIVESRWTLVRDDAGQPKSILVINTDVTETRRLEQNMLRAQRMECIDTLAGGIAHDLNNVLQPVVLSIDTLTPRLPDPESTAIFQMMRANILRGTSLIRQLLLFARGSEGPRMTVQAATLVREISGVVQTTFPKTIFYAGPGDVSSCWPLLGDPTQLYQVLLNLCLNARDAMPHGGQLSLTVENVEVDDVTAATQPDAQPGRHVAFTLTDTGCGIPPHLRAKIFDPFFTTKDVGQGTGLGLSTSLSIVQSHGGFITVQAGQNGGTCFRVFLPVNPETVEGEAPFRLPQAEETPRGSGERILVVDDEPTVRSAMKQTLECFGYEVTLAQDGVDGLRCYAEDRSGIKAVITDVAMPNMDGPALIRTLQRLDPSVKTLVTTGMASELSMQSLRSLGITQVITKPCDGLVILRALHELLHGESSASQLRPAHS